LGASPAQLSFSAHTAETLSSQPPPLEAAGLFPVQKGFATNISLQLTNCFHTSLWPRRIPQPNPPIPFLKYAPVTCAVSYRTLLTHCILSSGGKSQLPRCTSIYLSFPFDIPICWLTLCLYCSHRREHFVFLCAVATATTPGISQERQKSRSGAHSS